MGAIGQQPPCSLLQTDGRWPQAPANGNRPLPASDRGGRARDGTRMMNWKRLWLRLRYLLRHGERQRLLWEEMNFHIESMTQDLVDGGVPEREARAAAHRKFGDMTRKSEESRGTWIAQWIDDLGQDLKHAFRGMRRDLGFTLFVILIAGLGIGA